MASVPALSICLFSYFTFIPLLFFSQMFVVKVAKWRNPLAPIGSPKLFDFKRNEVFFLLLTAVSLIVFAKIVKNEFPFIQFFIYFNTIVFLILLLLFNFFLAKKTSQFELDTLLIISVWLLFAITTFCFCKNFIILMFNIELIATSYFFFFLFFITKDLTTLTKFKNLLSNYLFVSLFTICGFSVAMYLIVYWGGTADFRELNYVGRHIPFFIWNLLLLTFLTKLGGPGVFFFKVEIYKVLTIYSVIFFSISSFLINSMIMLFVFKLCVSFYTLNSFLILCGLLASNCFVLIRGFQLTSFAQFLGLSAVNTWGLLMTFFLVYVSNFY